MDLPRAIAIEGLTKTFADVKALDAVSLTAARGEVFGLLGPDGAGKTTLMRILCGIMPADSGSVMVAGDDVLRHPEQVKPRIGYLSQRFALYRDLSVEENVRFTAQIFGVQRDEYRARLAELLAITRLAPFTDRLAGKLSGGMKQKLALMCCLIHRPEVLLLDEPTTGVDPASRRDFWHLLRDLPEQGVTVMVSTPYMDEAERCDRLALLHHGRVVAAGTVDEIKDKVTGSLFGITAEPQAQARAVLAGLPAVGAVVVFGDRLHVTAAAGTLMETLLAPLRGAGVRVEHAEPIEAGLEDAFAELVGGDSTDG